MKLTYSQQLAHPLWQRRRLEMLSEAGWACRACLGTDKQLHVHHRQYFKDRMAWEYLNAELQVLCKECHERSHIIDDQIKAILCQVPPGEVLALLAGFFNVAIGDDQLNQIYQDNCTIYDAASLANCLREDRPELTASLWQLVWEADQERVAQADVSKVTRTP